MLPKSNQLEQLYCTAKIHKSNNIQDITLHNLNSHPINVQSGT